MCTANINISGAQPAWEQAYDQVEQQLDQLLHIKPQAKSAQDLFRLLQQYDHMMVDYSKVSNYAFYRHTEDATDESNQNRIGRSHALAKKSTQLSSELVNHLLATPSELIETYIEQEPQLPFVGTNIDFSGDAFMSTLASKEFTSPLLHFLNRLLFR